MWYNPVTGEGPVSDKPGAEICDPAYWNELYGDWVEVGADFVRPKTSAEIQRELEAAVDAFMDSKARVKGFRDRHSFALRAGITGSSWHAQALVFGAWMDAVNDYCYQVQLDCMDGKRTVPTVDELLAELPKMEGE